MSKKTNSEDQINPDKLEIPKIIFTNSDNFMKNPIESFNININKFNNINDASLKNGLDINKISSIQKELLNRLKDNIKFNFMNENESKNFTVVHKKVPIFKRKNNDNPTITWDN